jgi:hypothetical protein
MRFALAVTALVAGVSCSSESADQTASSGGASSATSGGVQNGTGGAAGDSSALGGGNSRHDGGAGNGGTGRGGNADGTGNATQGGGRSDAGTGAGGSGGNTTDAGGAEGDAAIVAACAGLPFPQAKALPEPNTADPTATLKEIVISGPPSTYAVGGSSSMVGIISASLLDQGIYSDGSVRHIENLTADIDYHTRVVWTSSDPTIAGVASGDSRTAGGIEGFRAGTVKITVTLDGVSKSVCFVVTPPVVQMVTISGPGSAVPPIVAKPGDVVALTCTETLTDGTKLDATAKATWASSQPSVATVSSTGSANALAGGTTTITATLPPSTPRPRNVSMVPAGSATLDVIGSTGLGLGSSCGGGGTCAAGLSCCQSGRNGPLYCAPTPCPPPVP